MCRAPRTLVVHVTPGAVREVARVGWTEELHLLPRGAAPQAILAAHHQVPLPVISSDLHQDLQSIHLTHLAHHVGANLLSGSSVRSRPADVLENIEWFAVSVGY